MVGDPCQSATFSRLFTIVLRHSQTQQRERARIDPALRTRDNRNARKHQPRWEKCLCQRNHGQLRSFEEEPSFDAWYQRGLNLKSSDRLVKMFQCNGAFVELKANDGTFQGECYSYSYKNVPHEINPTDNQAKRKYASVTSWPYLHDRLLRLLTTSWFKNNPFLGNNGACLTENILTTRRINSFLDVKIKS